jgi:hypothetical protein
MRPRLRTLLGLGLLGSGLVLVGIGERRSWADEPSRLGRLFRFGNSANPPAETSRAPSLPPPPSNTPFPLTDSGPRLVPQPRVSRPVTESDPILTRVAIGRSDNGTRFGMFLQVYGDGTVLDGEGVHHVGRDVLKPLVEAIQNTDAFRLKGHCGNPSADFVEQVHIIIYERSLGRLRASSFSYSGNPDGCDHAMKHLHAAIEAIQTKISAPQVAAPLVPVAPTSPPPSVPPNATVIPLTPVN